MHGILYILHFCGMQNPDYSTIVLGMGDKMIMDVSIVEGSVSDPMDQSSLLVFDDMSFLELGDVTNDSLQDASLDFEEPASPMSLEEQPMIATPTGSDITLPDTLLDDDDNWEDADGRDEETSQEVGAFKCVNIICPYAAPFIRSIHLQYSGCHLKLLGTIWIEM